MENGIMIHIRSGNKVWFMANVTRYYFSLPKKKKNLDLKKLVAPTFNWLQLTTSAHLIHPISVHATPLMWWEWESMTNQPLKCPSFSSKLQCLPSRRIPHRIKLYSCKVADGELYQHKASILIYMYVCVCIRLERIISWPTL